MFRAATQAVRTGPGRLTFRVICVVVAVVTAFDAAAFLSPPVPIWVKIPLAMVLGALIEDFARKRTRAR